MGCGDCGRVLLSSTRRNRNCCEEHAGDSDPHDQYLLESEYTAASVLERILTVDGAGSGLDSDLLDGLNSSAFSLDGHTHIGIGAHTHAGEDIISGLVADLRIASTIARDSEVMTVVLSNDGTGSGLDADLLDGLNSTAFALASHVHAGEDITSGTVADARIASTITRDSEVFTIVLAADGVGSGLDADLLDGLNSTDFALVSHTHAGEDITSGTVADARIASTITRDSEVFGIVLSADGAGSGLDADLLDGVQGAGYALVSHVHAGEDITSGTIADARIASTITRDSEVFTIVLAADGIGSLLDADLLDGLNSSAFALVSHTHAGEDITSGTIADARIASTITRDSEVFGIVLANDGSGSGLDADLLDGLSSADFALASHTHAGEDITSGTVADARIDSTLTNKTLVTPTIASFVNAAHTHANAAGGGQLSHASALTALDFASAGHTGFPGLAVANTYTTQPHVFNAPAAFSTGTLQVMASSAFRCIVLTNSSANNVSKGGMILGHRFAIANNPFPVFNAWDNGSERVIYVGGGGWGCPDSTQFRIYTAPSYTEVNDQGLLRFIVLNNGRIAVGNLTPTALMHIGPSTTGNAQLRFDPTGAADPATPNDGDVWKNGAVVLFGSSSATDSIVNHLRLRRESTGTPAAGFGAGLQFALESSTTANQDAGRIAMLWNVATHASRVADMVFYANNQGTEREFLRGRGGAAAEIGFLGATPVARPAAFTQTYSTADRTLAAYTSDPESGAYTGIDNAQGGTPYAQLTDLNLLRTAYETLRVFVEDAVQLLNALVDDQQAYGLAA